MAKKSAKKKSNKVAKAATRKSTKGKKAAANPGGADAIVSAIMHLAGRVDALKDAIVANTSAQACDESACNDVHACSVEHVHESQSDELSLAGVSG